jgi:hypothetical protein
MKKLIYLILAVTFAILAHSASGSIAFNEFQLYNVGIQVGNVHVTSNTAKNDLMMAVTQDESLTAEQSLIYSHQILIEEANPYKDRLDQMKKDIEEEIASLSFRKNIYTFLAAVFGLILVVSLFKKEEENRN